MAWLISEDEGAFYFFLIFIINLFYIKVVRGGIEPPTLGFSVLCSTN